MAKRSPRSLHRTHTATPPTRKALATALTSSTSPLQETSRARPLIGSRRPRSGFNAFAEKFQLPRKKGDRSAATTSASEQGCKGERASRKYRQNAYQHELGIAQQFVVENQATPDNGARALHHPRPHEPESSWQQRQESGKHRPPANGEPAPPRAPVPEASCRRWLCSFEIAFFSHRTSSISAYYIKKTIKNKGV